MPSLYTVSVVCRRRFSTVALIAAALSVASSKGKKVNVLEGRTNFWWMPIIFLTAIRISFANINIFLLLIPRWLNGWKERLENDQSIFKKKVIIWNKISFWIIHMSMENCESNLQNENQFIPHVTFFLMFLWRYFSIRSTCFGYW